MQKTALITGATRGIGLAIARELSSDYHIIVGGRSSKAVHKVCTELPSASPFVADLSHLEDIETAAPELQTLDLLVHSAGICRGSTVAETSWQTWREVLDVNVLAVAELTRVLLPALRDAHGQIITINSGSGFFSSPSGGVYAASKFALRAFTDALREEERGRVRVSSIHPGRVDTDMQVELQAAAGRPYNGSEHLRPESVAAAVRLAADASPEATVEEISIRPTRGRLS